MVPLWIWLAPGIITTEEYQMTLHKHNIKMGNVQLWPFKVKFGRERIIAQCEVSNVPSQYYQHTAGKLPNASPVIALQ